MTHNNSTTSKWNNDNLIVVGKLAVGTEQLLGEATVNVKGKVIGEDFITTSSVTLKENIQNISGEKALEALAQLNPVSFNYKSDVQKETHLGFIAEEVPDLVANIDRKGVSAMDLVALLTKVVQEQQKNINTLRQEISTLIQEKKSY